MKTQNQLSVTLLALLALGVTAHAAEIKDNVAVSSDPLEAGFLNPPDSARPQTWWHWMNGNITKAGITADLEAMKEIGLGGATIVNVDCGIPRGPVEFMSPEWREDFKFAVQEANRLGLKLGVLNGAGWSNTGGPWITATNAMQRVTTSEVHVTGPTNYSAVLPQPPTKLNFYRDIALLAFPKPAGEGLRMQDFAPVATVSSGPAPGDKLTDGNDRTVVTLPALQNGQTQFAQLEFTQPFAARMVKLTGPGFPVCSGQIMVSDDGLTFRTVKPFGFDRKKPTTLVVPLGEEPVTGRFWRVQFDTPGRWSQGEVIPLGDIELSPRLVIGNIAEKTVDANSNSGIPILSARDAGPTTEGAVPRRGMVNLASQMDAAGKLTWQVPSGQWVILRVGYTPTGMPNHPAPKGGAGLECDKFSKAALDAHWDGFMQKVLDDIGPLAGKTLESSLIDSYEVGGQNWAKDFRQEFQRRRGYDPVEWLPTFTGRVVDTPALSERFLWDLRRTIADLFAENYYGRFAELCRQHGLANAIEPYPGPYESIQSGAAADVVMGEFWSGSTKHSQSSVKLAASIAHIYGKTIVGAESFTAYPANARWMNHPYTLKVPGDLAYCQGVNRYIFHRYAMQPWTHRSPGMTMGQWGIHFDRTVTWWKQGKAWIDYITHCQFLLQQGRAVADVAYFNGQSAPSEMRVFDPRLPVGYDYDAVNADVLLNGATVKDGRIVLRSGANYAVLVLPPSDSNLTPPVLECLRTLVRAGATVIGARPQHSPSLTDYPACDAQVNELAEELWGQGRIRVGQSLAEVFAAQHLPPDFEYRGEAGATQLAYTHRIDGAADIYFVSNQRGEFTSADCTFRVAGKVPELWHPDTGTIEPAPVWSTRDGRTTVRLNFEPAGSVFVVFRRPSNGADHLVAATGNFAAAPGRAPQWKISLDGDGSPVVKAWSNGRVDLQTAGGKRLQFAASNVPAPQELTGSWQLEFPPDWGAPPSVTLDKLISWTDHPDTGVKYFSGTATYEKEIKIPADRIGDGREIWLDLGQVKELAEVSLNGHEFGVLWKPPFRVNVTAAAKPGSNKLVVKVTNLWPNRLIGDEQLPPDCEWYRDGLKAWPQWLLDGKPSPTGRLTFTTWHHWKKDDALLESGLLGPVTLESVGIIKE